MTFQTFNSFLNSAHSNYGKQSEKRRCDRFECCLQQFLRAKLASTIFARPLLIKLSFSMRYFHLF